EAKPAHADGTATGRLWESKSPPTPNNTTKYRNNKEGDGQATVSLLLRFASLASMDQLQVSNVADQVGQGILGLGSR
ncbi:MAG: hypothetical protein E7C83_11410, partial [Corynebacterium sp.]|uniref:hypothetical protein n=1 Tax=Corynebacterium sp. TaxID=1720 RepID=UPI0029023D2B